MNEGVLRNKIKSRDEWKKQVCEVVAMNNWHCVSLLRLVNWGTRAIHEYSSSPEPSVIMMFLIAQQLSGDTCWIVYLKKSLLWWSVIIPIPPLNCTWSINIDGITFQKASCLQFCPVQNWYCYDNVARPLKTPMWPSYLRVWCQYVVVA